MIYFVTLGRTHFLSKNTYLEIRRNPMNTTVSPIFRFWNMLSLYRGQLSQIYLLGILNGVVNLSLPLGIQAIINFIQGAQISTSWVVLVGFVLLGITFTGIFQIMQLRIVENIQQDIFTRSSFEFAVRVPKIKLLEMDKIHSPELVNRFFDTITIQKGMPKILIDFSLASFQIVFGLLLLAFYSPYFIILGFVLIFILWLVIRVTGPKGLDASLMESKYKYRIAHWLEEVARTNKSFKLNTNSNLHLKKTDKLASKYLKARESHFSVLLMQFKFFIAFKVLLAAGLLVLGSILVLNEQMNIGQFVASEIMIILIINSVEKLLRIIDTIYDVLTALEKIGYVTDLKMDEQDGIALFDKDKGISLEGRKLKFGYPDKNAHLIEGLSFKIPAGCKTMVKGESGSGKSTFLHVMGGLLDINEGDFLINGVSIKNINKDKYFSKIGYYFPTNQLFVGSFYDNLTMGKAVSDERVFEIIRLLDLQEFISSLPMGIQAEIDPEGRRLPKSVIEKVLIGRAIIHKPKLLIMDDPLLFVTKEEKHRIITHIMSPEQPWTVLVATVYPFWKQNCTQIIDLGEVDYIQSVDSDLMI